MKLGKPYAKGNTANVYLQEDRAIKIYHDHISDSEPAYEATKQRIAFDCNLPVPKILEVTKINGKNALVMEYVSGKTLGQLFMDNTDRTEYYLEMSVDIQKEIHTKKAESLMSMQEKLKRQIHKVSHLSREVKDQLLSKMQEIKYEPRLCHGDFHLYNLIQSEERAHIIDWVDASSGDIRADVYRTYLLYSQFSSELAEKYLYFYCKKSGVTREEIFQWAPIIAAARLSEKVGTKEDSEKLMNIVHQMSPHF
ncbi:phosphotransferase family protein [Sutcliffiella rhizosphaerae]|uniref:Thiamine kinase n=1 Tax=Sutcliffiella rhizosphaerae TaxID=2880967 RepID=A0ABM8YRD6_9BACI|nr:aminoglycoside phosphotransferase family protein [Sutcliffiella rhizosphaerae]CAG9622469.1 Thiamine kinase [Sutcliffiella rhizosphaerae]